MFNSPLPSLLLPNKSQSGKNHLIQSTKPLLILKRKELITKKELKEELRKMQSSISVSKSSKIKSEILFQKLLLNIDLSITISKPIIFI